MKQMIVMISMIVLGIAIAGFIGEFKDSADTLHSSAIENIEDNADLIVG